MSYDRLFKILLVGDNNAGKTDLQKHFCQEPTNTSFITSIGIDFRVRVIERGGKRFKLQIWDTAGTERFKVLSSSFTKGTNGIVVCFNPTDRSTFESLEAWMRGISQIESPVKTVVCGVKNSSDVPDSVSSDEIITFAKKHDLQYTPVVLNEDIGVDLVFETLINLIVK